MEPNHMHNVIAFFAFFAICGLAAYVSSPKKSFSRGRIAVGECLKPNPKRKGGSWREGDIKIGDDN